MTDAMLSLAARCAQASVPSRLLDFEIHIAIADDPIWPSQDHIGRITNPNSRMSDYLSTFRDVIDADDQDFDFPRYSGSIDAAVSIVPPGWYWAVGRTSSFCGWAKVYQTHPDHGEEGQNEFFSNCEHWKPVQIPPVSCLLACILRARASKAFQREQREAST